MTPKREYKDFMSRRNWKTSKRGNLWRVWEGITLTIFDQDGAFVWCVADSEGRRYSRQPSATLEESMTHLAAELGII